MTLDLMHRTALVLNADYRPMTMNPLSTFSWMDALRGVLLDKYVVVEEYDDVVHSPTREMRLPSVIMRRKYVDNRRLYRRASLTRWNLFLAFDFRCNFCGLEFDTKELTFEHVLPRARGGLTEWINIVPACVPCNLKKGCRTPEEARMPMRLPVQHPTFFDLEMKSLRSTLMHNVPDERWLDIIYWQSTLQK